MALNLLIADTRKDVGRGHQSRISALHHALGGHIVEMDDSVPCGIRLDGELICSGLEYALIRPEVVALRPEKPRPDVIPPLVPRKPFTSENRPLGYFGLRNNCPDWIQAILDARWVYCHTGVTALEACCLGVPVKDVPLNKSHHALHEALAALSHEERFQVIDGQGAQRVAKIIRDITKYDDYP